MWYNIYYAIWLVTCRNAFNRPLSGKDHDKKSPHLLLHSKTHHVEYIGEDEEPPHHDDPTHNQVEVTTNSQGWAGLGLQVTVHHDAQKTFRVWSLGPSLFSDHNSRIDSHASLKTQICRPRGMILPNVGLGCLEVWGHLTFARSSLSSRRAWGRRLTECGATFLLTGTSLHYTVISCTVPYHTVISCTVPYHTVISCSVLYHTVISCSVLYHTVISCTVLYHTVLSCTVLYHTVISCTVLYHTVISCTVLLWWYTVCSAPMSAHLGP